MDIAIFTHGDISNPSSRLRGYYIAKEFSKLGFNVMVFPRPRAKGNFFKRASNIAIDVVRKLNMLFRINRQVTVFIQRGISRIHIMSLIFVLFAKIKKHKIIYDIDDALFLEDKISINTIIRLSDLVVVGSRELYKYCKKINKNVVQIPTSVDIAKYKEILSIRLRNRYSKKEKVVLGFIGSPTTTRYLGILVKPLAILSRKYDFELRVISAPSYSAYVKYNFIFEAFKKRNVNTKLIPWTPSEEIRQLSLIDIGLAPLTDGLWERYKGGFKVINYMAAGIPPVASRVGEHIFLIHDGVNGFLCKDEKEWVAKLGILIENPSLRLKMGQKAAEHAHKMFSLEINAKRLGLYIKHLIQ